MLRLDAIESSYGQNQVLFGTTLEMRQGEVVALMGRNGMGKTTTVNNIVGLLRPHGGSIHFEDRQLDSLPPHRITKLGIALVPEGRQVFPTLSVRENLVATAANHGQLRERWTLERVYELFPQLFERRSHMGNHLSGGEQQMLAIGRALMLCPKLLILDEATEGLAPIIREKIWQCLISLKESGLSILLIDKNLDELAPLADRIYVIEKGRVVWNGATAELTSKDELRLRYLGV
ncbi:MAG TPA: ABC transporter ATP-binding protein [Xanthobacteraceae bacterium]|jgi:branched-chain amino acid transport system ATP-binding protein